MQVNDKIFTIYRLIFPNNKSYIGITSRPMKRRLGEHKNQSKTGKLKIHSAIQKYGFDNVQCVILMQTSNKNECYSKEVEYIAQYNTKKSGYNSSIGGERGAYGCVRSLETRKKISETKRKKPYRWRDNPEALERRVKAQIGRKQTDFQKQRARESNSHKHLVYYTNGSVVQIKGLKAYSVETGIPFDTLRYSLYNCKPVPSWCIEKIVKA